MAYKISRPRSVSPRKKGQFYGAESQKNIKRVDSGRSVRLFFLKFEPFGTGERAASNWKRKHSLNYSNLTCPEKRGEKRDKDMIMELLRADKRERLFMST